MPLVTNVAMQRQKMQRRLLAAKLSSTNPFVSIIEEVINLRMLPFDSINALSENRRNFGLNRYLFYTILIAQIVACIRVFLTTVAIPRSVYSFILGYHYDLPSHRIWNLTAGMFMILTLGMRKF